MFTNKLRESFDEIFENIVPGESPQMQQLAHIDQSTQLVAMAEPHRQQMSQKTRSMPRFHQLPAGCHASMAHYNEKFIVWLYFTSKLTSNFSPDIDNVQGKWYPHQPVTETEQSEWNVKVSRWISKRQHQPTQNTWNVDQQCRSFPAKWLVDNSTGDISKRRSKVCDACYFNRVLIECKIFIWKLKHLPSHEISALVMWIDSSGLSLCSAAITIDGNDK